MRLISLGYRKVKAVQCYLSLLVWLILASLGLYWFLNRNGTQIATLSQTGHGRSGFGYQDAQPVYQDSGESSSGGEGIKNKDITNDELPTHDNASNQKDEKGKRTKSMIELEKVGIGKQSEPGDVVNRLCNPLSTIKANEENAKDPDFKLEAVVILFRHGDRGPLNHIGHRNVSHINCEAKSPEFEQLSKFVSDTLIKLPGYSQFIGPFHSFPKVPSSPFCSLGQLSQLGSAQLLALGKLVRSTYRSSLVNLTSFNSNHDIPQSSSLKVAAYSTRYRRTFQSLFAFLYGLLGPRQIIPSTTIHESQSIAFCFKHCSCKAADRLKKAANKKFKPNQLAKEIMTKLVAQLNSVLGTEKSKKAGSSLLDSLLVYPCHNKELPCHQDKHKDTKVQLLLRTIKNLSLYHHYSSNPLSPPCVTIDHLKTLVELINAENEGLKAIPESHKYHLLNSYGLLKEIVNLALRMTTSPSSLSAGGVPLWRKHPQTPLLFPPDSVFTSSLTNNNNNYFRNPPPGGGDRTGKVVVFSGHDTTLQSITAAIGILGGHPDAHLPPFGSRLIFEFYRRIKVLPNSPQKLHFRVVYNGIAVTHLVSFCKEKATENSHAGRSKSDTIKTANNFNTKFDGKVFFCPIENLVRFIHDNYFNSFDNATNFKDACRKSL